MKLPRFVVQPVLLAVVLCGASVFAEGRAATTAKTIVITNSGATDLIGFRIAIGPDGEADYASGDGSGRARLPLSLRERLARDVAHARLLAKLATGMMCAKSASFGTSTFIAVGTDRSPDLSCAGDKAAQALMDDATAIATQLHLRTVSRSEGHPLPPQDP